MKNIIIAIATITCLIINSNTTSYGQKRIPLERKPVVVESYIDTSLYEYGGKMYQRITPYTMYSDGKAYPSDESTLVFLYNTYNNALLHGITWSIYGIYIITLSSVFLWRKHKKKTIDALYFSISLIGFGLLIIFVNLIFAAIFNMRILGRDTANACEGIISIICIMIGALGLTGDVIDD